jgi:hypothetical protein
VTGVWRKLHNEEGEEECIQGVGGKTRKKELLRRER